MSGHSKWSKVKHQKESADSARGKVFTKMANSIIVAVKTGGGITDPNANFKLRIALDRARQFNMPKENIKHAIERASGVGDENQLEEVIYEAFGPGGYGIIIEAATNNRQRTVAELKNILDRNGGSLVANGAVSHLFKFIGKIEVEKGNYSYDEILEKAVNVGAIDILEDKSFEIYTNPSDLHKLRDALVSDGLTVISAELIYQPTTPMEVTDVNIVSQLERLINLLEEHEDVQKVFVNAKKKNNFIITR